MTATTGRAAGPMPTLGRLVEPVLDPERARALVRAAAALAVLLVVAGAWVGVRAWQAAAALQDARAWLDRVELDAGSALTVPAGLSELRASTSAAARASADPVWRAAEVLPWVGDQLEAVRVVSAALDDVVTDVVPAATGVRRLLDGGARDPAGRLDVPAVRSVAVRARAAAATAADAHAEVRELDVDGLAGPLAGPVREARDALARVDGALGPAGHLAAALPGMLGGDGPRTYLVLALNTAELRAAGGIVGTVVAVQVHDGAVTVVDRRTTEDLRGLDVPVVPLSPEELDTWGDRLGRWIQDAVLTPDFPRTAELIAARWASEVGGPVDGVVATDVVAVADLVGATGPVTDPDGRVLDGGALVGALLRDAYVLHPDAQASDAYFGAVATAVVGAVGSGAGEPQALLAAGRRALDERRVRVWSAHPDEQAVLVGTAVGGAFTSPVFADQPGLFLDDATQGKLGGYLTTGLTFHDGRCAGPAPSVRAVLRLELAVPPEGVRWPRYVTGSPGPGVPRGTLLTTVSVWSTTGAAPVVVTRDGAPVTGGVTSVAGRTVQQLASRLGPGQAQEFSVELPLQDGAVTLWTTPTLTSPGAATYRCP